MRLVSLSRIFGLGELSARERRALPVAYAASLANIMGVNLLYPVLPAMVQQLGTSQAAVGLVIAAYTAPAIVLAPLFGALADFRGRRALLGWGLLGFGVAGVGAGFAPGLEWVIAWRLLQGVAMSALTPLTIVLIGDLLEGEREIGGQGLKVFLDRIGIFAFPLLGGLLAASSWAFPFFLFGLAIPLGIWALARFPETKGEVALEPLGYLKGIIGLARKPRLLVAFGAGFLRFFLDYGFFTYFPLFLAAIVSASPATIGLLFGCFSAGAMLSASQVGRWSRHVERGRLLFVAFLLSGATLIAFPFLPAVGWAVPLLVLYGLANGIVSPIQKSLLTQNAPSELRSGIVSVDRLVQQVAKSLSPTLLGLLLLTGELSQVFWVLGVLAALSVVLAAAFLGGRG